MNSSAFGFQLLRLRVHGPGLPDAELEFQEGLNVISGASDTGKSYLVACLDYMLAASTPPEVIPECEGYTSVTLTIRRRSDEEVFHIHRSFGSKLCRVDSARGLHPPEVWPVQLQPKGTHSLSNFLLELTGLDGRRLRKNARGETRQLSYRDVAHLTLVDETRIISKVSPVLSGQYTSATAESSAFRLLVTGEDDTIDGAEVPKKDKVEGAKGKAALVADLMDRLRHRLAGFNIDDSQLDEDLSSLSLRIADSLRVRDDLGERIAALEAIRRAEVESLRVARSKLSVVEGLEARFRLLQQHYETDIARLLAVQEAGAVLAEYPETTCPLCGAPPSTHSHDRVDPEFSVTAVRESATAELSRIHSLVTDLQVTLAEVARERTELAATVAELEESIAHVTAQVGEVLRPQLVVLGRDIADFQSRKERLHEASLIRKQLEEYQAIAQELAQMLQAAAPAGELRVTSASDVDQLCRVMEEVLLEWGVPSAGRVVFSERESDFVVGGQSRASHGKGLRALVAAAFTVALMRWCQVNSLPHPRVIVLDSPLVAYRPPDPGEHRESDDWAVVEANVRDKFYTTLSNWPWSGQVVIVENEHPPRGLSLKSTRFTKAAHGRHGFFPK